jgi:hypothetical protein
VDPTPSLLSFGKAITLVRQRLNASGEKAAVVVREALKSGELHIIRDEHVDPTSGSQFAIVEEDFLEWLNRRGHPGDHAATHTQARSRAGKAGCD